MIDVRFTDGTLQLALPKAEKALPRQIVVENG